MSIQRCLVTCTNSAFFVQVDYFRVARDPPVEKLRLATRDPTSVLPTARSESLQGQNCAMQSARRQSCATERTGKPRTPAITKPYRSSVKRFASSLASKQNSHSFAPCSVMVPSGPEADAKGDENTSLTGRLPFL